MSCNTKYNLIGNLEDQGFLEDGKIQSLSQFETAITEFEALGQRKYNMPTGMSILKEIKTTSKEVGRAGRNSRKAVITTNRPIWNVEYFTLLDSIVEDFNSNELQARQQNIQDAQRAGVDYNDDYLFNSRREAPEGNNYTEFVRYKQLRLKDIHNETTRLKITLKNASLNTNTDISKINSKIKALENEASAISRQLESLSQDEPKFMFHAIEEDLSNLEKALNTDNIIDVNKVNTTLDFLDEFISGTNKEFKGQPLSEYTNPDFNNIAGKLKELQDKATTKILETSRNAIENSQLVQNLIESNEDLDTDTLFQAQKDLNWLET